MRNTRHLRFSALAALLMFLSMLPPGSVQVSHADVPPDDLDPQLPLFLQGKIDKTEYLKARGDYVNLLRGLPYNLPYDARAAALRQQDQQVADRNARVARGLESRAATSPWTALGPAPIPNGQTSGITAPVSGRITAIAVHPTISSTLYVGTAQGGVYRSLDAGQNWTAIFDSAQSLAIGAIAIAPSSPSIVYVGTGEASSSCDSYAGVGLYRIDNADTSATLVGPINPTVITSTTAFGGRAISQVLVHPTDPATVFASTVSAIAGSGCDDPATLPSSGLLGVYRSTNATTTLASNVAFDRVTVTTAGDRPVTDMVFEPGNPNNLVVGVKSANAPNEGGIYRSSNALASPASTIAFTQVKQFGSVRSALAINKVGGTVTVLAAAGISNGTLYESTDGGQTWPTTLTAANGFCGGQCFYDIVVNIDPVDSSRIYLGGNSGVNIFRRSIDSGTTFTPSVTSLHADSHAIAVAASDTSVIYTGNDGGIWRSNDFGVTWTDLNNSQFFATQFSGVAVHPTDRNFLLGGTQDNGTVLRRADSTWFRADFGDGGYALIDNNATDTTNVTMYHTYFNQAGNLIGLARVNSTTCASDDGTNSQWVFRGAGFVNGTIGSCEGVALAANSGIGLSPSAVLFYAPMALGPGNPNTLYFGTDQLFRSANKGDTMTAVSQQLVFGVPVSSIAVSAQNDNVRLVGLRNGKLFATSTGANPLVDVTSGSMPANFVGRVAIAPTNSSTAYAAFGGYGVTAGQHVWKTTNLADVGTTWAAAGTGIPDVPVNALAIDPLDSNVVYAGTDIGVYRTTNGGTSWAPYGTGLPRTAVFGLEIQPTYRLLRAGTHGKGIYEVGISEVPALTALSPITTTALGPTFTLGISGSNFITGTTAFWNGSPLPTTLVSSSQLTATVSAVRIASTGVFTVAAQNPGTELSNALNFTVTQAAQTISFASQPNRTFGDPPFAVTATATSGLAVSLASGGPCSVASFTVTLTGTGQCVLTATQAGNGTYFPAPAVARSFTVNAPVPALSGVTPSALTIGGPDTTITVTGSGFVQGATVQWKASDSGATGQSADGRTIFATSTLSTTYVSATSLTATVPAALLAIPGSATVTVVNPPPGGGTSTGVVVTLGTQVFVPEAGVTFGQQ